MLINHKLLQKGAQCMKLAPSTDSCNQNTRTCVYIYVKSAPRLQEKKLFSRTPQFAEIK